MGRFYLGMIYMHDFDPHGKYSNLLSGSIQALQGSIGQ